MTIFDIKDDIKNKLGKRVKVEVYGNRNRKEVLTGVITNMYKNIFLVLSKDINRSFSYSDILIGDVKIQCI